MDTNKIRQEITSAYQILSTLRANGDAIDVLAAVRSKLRRAISELEAAEKPVTSEEKNDG